MSRKTGSHLIYEERCQIYALLQIGKSRRAIAKQLKTSHVTILRELKRNTGKRGYRFKQAEKKAKSRRCNASSQPKKMTKRVICLIEEMLLTSQSSPQQISGRLKKEYNIAISAETIYRYIWRNKKNGGLLYKNLRHKAKKYNKRGAKKAGRGLIPNRVDIDQRPAIVEQKQRFGDFELDTIIGANHCGAIVSIVDRASKYTMLSLVSRATAQDVSKAICDNLASLAKKNLIHTLTADNGKEFSLHAYIAQALGCAFYFAKPYHSWERGLNEHTNGLVRQYFPKKTDFSKLTTTEINNVQHKLNNRPRKILDFSTPNEVFFKLTHSFISGNFQS